MHPIAEDKARETIAVNNSFVRLNARGFFCEVAIAVVHQTQQETGVRKPDRAAAKIQQSLRHATSTVIANLDETTGYWINLSANADGSFRVMNGRTGAGKNYPGRRGEGHHVLLGLGTNH